MAQRLNGEWSDSEGNILSPLPNPSKIANNCTTTAEGYVLDARQGKKLQDQVNVVNSNLGTLTTNGAVTKFTPQADGLYATYKVGADTVTKKLGSREFTISRYNSVTGSGSNGLRINTTGYSKLIYSYAGGGWAEVKDQSGRMVLNPYGGASGTLDLTGITMLNFSILNPNNTGGFSQLTFS